MEEVIDFCVSVGLPVTLAEMGVTKIDPEKLMEVAKTAAAEGETIYNMPFEITAEKVYAAILTADAIGKEFSGVVA